MATKKVRCTLCDGSGVVTRIHKTETSCGIARATCPRCRGTGQKEVPITNADRIRAMSDEELAMFLDATQYREWEEIQENQREKDEYRSCVEGWTKWLKQPAEEE